MKLRVIDFETSNTDKAKVAGKDAGLVEIGWTDVTAEGVISLPDYRLVNPGHKINPSARGVHHISDEMVVDAITEADAINLLMEGMQSGDVFVAHNAKFERAFFDGGAFPWICTMICAQHLWEDAPDFKNQTLRYWLNVDQDIAHPELTMPAHRAGPDTYITAHILIRQMNRASPHELLRLTTTPVLQKTVRFGGKHHGKPWSEMDRGFLEWVIDKDFDEETKHTARHWLKALNKPANPFI